MSEKPQQYQEIIEDIYQWTALPPQKFTELSQGGNSFTIKFYIDNIPYVYKRYKQRPNDHRNRFQSEVVALNFFHTHHIMLTPQLIFADSQQKFIIYKFIDGTFLSQNEITPRTIEKAIDFYLSFSYLTQDFQSHHLLPAAESCLSMKQYFDNITFRIEKLKKSMFGESQLKLLQYLLFIQERIFTNITQTYSDESKNIQAELSHKDLILSQSDVGFHNLIYNQCTDEFTGIDFEYFGFDDPAKLVIDFLLQPKISLSFDLQKIALSLFITRFCFNSDVIKRIETLFPLLALKWSIIILNPLLYQKDTASLFYENQPIINMAIKKAHLALQQIEEMLDNRYITHLLENK